MKTQFDTLEEFVLEYCNCDVGDLNYQNNFIHSTNNLVCSILQEYWAYLEFLNTLELDLLNNRVVSINSIHYLVELGPVLYHNRKANYYRYVSLHAI